MCICVFGGRLVLCGSVTIETRFPIKSARDNAGVRLRFECARNIHMYMCICVFRLCASEFNHKFAESGCVCVFGAHVAVCSHLAHSERVRI